ncbi:MAG: hypothetical protein AB201_01345 [Parcubacteria bacterium C7867-006]|nr:MAG: hypothetical protein AB201_01345 [Parcubacteria bacterium C7867-006]
MSKIFKIYSQVWRWPGDMGWHFVTLPKNLSADIKKVGKRYGAGFVKVKVTVGKSTWVTALFPHKESESYLLSIKQNIRKKEGIWENDKIKASFVLEK